MKAFQVNEQLIYAAESLEDAITCAMVDFGASESEITAGFTPHEIDPASEVGDVRDEVPRSTMADWLEGVTEPGCLEITPWNDDE